MVTNTSRQAFCKNNEFKASNEKILEVLKGMGRAHTPQIVLWFDTNVPLEKLEERERERRIIGGLSDMKKAGLIKCVGTEINPRTNHEIEVYEACAVQGPARKTKLEEAREEIEALKAERAELKEQVEFLIDRNDRLKEELEKFKVAA